MKSTLPPPNAVAYTYTSNIVTTQPCLPPSTLKKMYNCLFTDGNCETFLHYGAIEQSNDAACTEFDLEMGILLGTPPNYYTSIYISLSVHAFVRVGNVRIGRYYDLLDANSETTDANGEVTKMYGEDESDMCLVWPSLLEMSIY